MHNASGVRWGSPDGAALTSGGQVMVDIFKTVLAAAALSFSQLSVAAVVFSDNFDTEATGLNTQPSLWTVTGGTVDIIGDPLVGANFFNLRPGNGLYIDLDGSTNDAGIMTSDAFALTPGVNYLLTFDLSGSARGTGSDKVTAGLDFNGDALFDLSIDVTLASTALFTTFSIPFTVGSIFTNAHIVFDHWGTTTVRTGGNNAGLLLDRVLLVGERQPGGGGGGQAITVPGSWMLLGAGLGLLGAVRRRSSAV